MKKDVKDNVMIEGLKEQFDFFVENATEKEYYELLRQQLVKQQVEVNALENELHNFCNFVVKPLLMALAGRDLFGSRDFDIKEESTKLLEPLIIFIDSLDSLKRF